MFILDSLHHLKMKRNKIFRCSPQLLSEVQLRGSLDLKGIPENISASLTELSSDLKAAAGTNLAGLILYGGLARGRYHPGRSDINIVVLLRDTSISSLNAVAPVLHAAWRAFRVEPLLLTPGEVKYAAETFPTKFLDIKSFHILIDGENPFTGIEVSPDRVRIRIEQELCNFSLRLRRRYLAIAQQEHEQTALLLEIARPLSLELASLLQLAGKEVPDEDRTLALFEAASREFGLDGKALEHLALLRQNPNAGVRGSDMFDKVLWSIDAAAAYVRRMDRNHP